MRSLVGDQGYFFTEQRTQQNNRCFVALGANLADIGNFLSGGGRNGKGSDYSNPGKQRVTLWVKKSPPEKTGRGFPAVLGRLATAPEGAEPATQENYTINGSYCQEGAGGLHTKKCRVSRPREARPKGCGLDTRHYTSHPASPPKNFCPLRRFTKSGLSHRARARARRGLRAAAGF